MKKLNTKHIQHLIKNKFNMSFIEFINRFVLFHKSINGITINLQENTNYKWLQNIYTNKQNTAKETTINTLAAVLICKSEDLIIEPKEFTIKKTKQEYGDWLISQNVKYMESLSDPNAYVEKIVLELIKIESK